MLEPEIVPGLVSVTFRQLAVAEVVAVAADAGLAAVEWGGDVHVPPGDRAAAEEARRCCDQHGLEITSYGSYYRAGVHDPEQFDAVVDTAVALGAPSIRVWAGDTGTAEAGPELRATVVRDLSRAVEVAGARSLEVALEFHRGTLTDTAESTRHLLDSVGPGLTSYWQPRPGIAVEDARAELALIGERLSTLHVFAWAADGARLPLDAGAGLWGPVLDSVRAGAGVRRRLPALLEFVAGDERAAFVADAATLRSWLQSRLGRPG